MASLTTNLRCAFVGDTLCSEQAERAHTAPSNVVCGVEVPSHDKAAVTAAMCTFIEPLRYGCTAP